MSKCPGVTLYSKSYSGSSGSDESENSDSDDYEIDVNNYLFIDYEQLYEICRDEFGFPEVKCEPDAWVSALCRKAVELEETNYDNKTLDKLSEIANHIEKFFTWDKSDKWFREVFHHLFMETQQDEDFDYEPLAKLLIETFKEASEYRKMHPRV